MLIFIFNLYKYTKRINYNLDFLKKTYNIEYYPSLTRLVTYMYACVRMCVRAQASFSIKYTGMYTQIHTRTGTYTHARAHIWYALPRQLIKLVKEILGKNGSKIG